MDYKIVEMQMEAYGYWNVKERFITSFQDEINKFLNKGYVPSGGICILLLPSGYLLFAQALIKN